MAHATYNATNNNWVLSTRQTVTANEDVMLYNNTKSQVRVIVNHSNANVPDFNTELSPGEIKAFKAVTAGNMNFVATPDHTAVNALIALDHDLPFDDLQFYNPADARIGLTVF